MNKKNLLKIANISGWLLLVIIIFYFISGYAMVKEYGFDSLMQKLSAWALHKYMTIPFFIFLFLHIVPYYVVRKQVRRLLAIVGIILLLSVSGAFAIDNILIKKGKPPTREEQREQKSKTVKCPNCPNECIIEPGEKGKCGEYENVDGELQPVQKGALNWYYPDWAADAKYNQPIRVLDTESALGRYALKTKEISLKDMALIHGHLCDGLVISYIQIKAVLEKLFPDGTIDRTDLRVVSKNGPCWVDAASMMTGARTNFGTLSIQPEIGDGFIIQRISTGEAYSVHLKDGVFPKEQAELENKIRTLAKQGKKVSLADIDKVEKMHNELSKKILNTSPDQLLDIKKLDKYNYEFKFQTVKRGDVINKNISR